MAVGATPNAACGLIRMVELQEYLAPAAPVRRTPSISIAT